jgi:hypothetical protein
MTKPDARTVLAVAGNLLQLLHKALLLPYRYREDHIQRWQLTVIIYKEPVAEQVSRSGKVYDSCSGSVSFESRE